MKKHQRRPETEAVHGGTNLDKKNGPLATPIYQTSTFEVTDNEQQLRATHTDMFYTRYGNPTNTVAESAIAELEGADAALLFASGMSAITTSILALLKNGELPPKPKKDTPPEETAEYESRRHEQSSERICVEHANAEHKQWRPLQRYLGRREYFDQTYAAIAGLVSDRAAQR